MKARAAKFLTWLSDPRHGRARPFFYLSLAACAGIWTADALPSWSASLWLAACVPAALLTPWKALSRTALLLLTVLAFAFAHRARDGDPLRDQVEARIRPGGATGATVTGMVADDPAADSTGTGFSFPLHVETLETPWTDTREGGARLYVHLRDFPPTLRYGDRITLTGVLRHSLPPQNPGEFDFPDFLRRQGFSAEFNAAAPHDRLRVLERDTGWPLMSAALRCRDWIGEVVTRDIRDDPELSATVRAMVLGTREKTPPEVGEAFIDSGTMHVFAVSGLHVVLFFGLMVAVLRMLRVPQAWILGIALPVMFFYVFITSLRPSAWRAALMAAMMVSAPQFNRESSLFNNLGLSALLLLGWDTQQLFQPGFTLSFGVLLALALLHPPLMQWVRPLTEHDPFLPRQLLTSRQRFWLWIKRGVLTSISVSLASTLGSAFLMIHYFSQFTPIGIVSNLFLVVLSEGILVVACASLAAGALGIGWLLAAINHCNWLLALASVRTAQFFASVPGGHFQVDPARWFRGDVCEITVLSLENGGAAHIDTPGGKHWLLDTGARRQFNRVVRPHLLRTPVNGLDGLLLSHKDAAHTGAAGEVRRVFHPVAQPLPVAGKTWTLEPGVTLRCLFPPAGWKAGLADDRCAVFLLECKDTRVLFMNDAGFITEKALLESGQDLRANILVKGRHARDYSGLPEFLNAVRPGAVVFTSHPFPEGESVPEDWIDLLRRKGIPFFDLSATGAAILRITPEATTATGFYNHRELTLPRGRD